MANVVPACAVVSLLCWAGVAMGCAARVVPIAKLAAQPCATAGRSVEWYGPTREADRSRLSAWCESVGPAVVAPPAAHPDRRRGGLSTVAEATVDHRSLWRTWSGAPDGPSTSSAELVVVTWNVHEGAADIERLVSSLRPAHVIVLAQEAMRRDDSVPASYPGSVGVPRREPGGGEARGDIVSIAARLRLWLAYVPSMRNGRDEAEDRGNAILSTLPLSAARAIELPWVHQRRVAVMADVTAPAGSVAPTLRVVSAHLDNRPGRVSQAASLAGWLRRFAADDSAPLIVGGDLNTWFGEREETVARIAEVVPVVTACGTRPTFRFRRRLDYLFSTITPAAVRGCDVAADPLGSDHRFLRLRLG